MKVIYENAMANIVLNGETLQCFSLRSGTRQGCLFSPSLFHTVLQFLTRAIGQEKEMKSVHIRKEEVKLSLFVDDTILYIENLKNSNLIPKLLELINQIQ